MYKPTTLVDGPPIHPDLHNVSYLGPRYLRDRGGDFTDTTLSAKLGSIGLDALILLPEPISGISIDGIDDIDDQTDIRLTEISGLEVGRENSRTNVRFGQLHIASETAKPVNELVAVKYIHGLTAPRELNAALAVNARLGKPAAFQPVGFIRGDDANIGYLSKYEHAVTSLDNILWNKSSPEALREHAMGFAGLWLAHLHNIDMIHGDAQAKNIAWDASQQPRYPDLETASDMKHGPMDTQTKRLVDISGLFNPQYMPPTNAEEEAIFIDSYTEHQYNRPEKLDGTDILDTIQSMRE